MHKKVKKNQNSAELVEINAKNEKSLIPKRTKPGGKYSRVVLSGKHDY